MMSAVDPTIAFTTLVGAVPATIAGLAAWRSTRKTHDEVRTNHGIRAGERIENLTDDMLWLKEHVVTKAEFAQHTADDAAFQERVEPLLARTEQHT